MQIMQQIIKQHSKIKQIMQQISATKAQLYERKLTVSMHK